MTTEDKCVTCGFVLDEHGRLHPFKARSQHLDAPYLLRVKKGSSFAFEVSCPELGLSAASESIPKCRERVRSLMRERMGAHQAEQATFRYTGSLTNTDPDEPAEDGEEDTGHPWDRPARTPDPCCSFCCKGVEDCGALIQATQPDSDVAICGECAVSAAHEVMTLAQRILETARDRTREAADGAIPVAMLLIKKSFDDCETPHALAVAVSLAMNDARTSKVVDTGAVSALARRVCDAKGW